MKFSNYFFIVFLSILIKSYCLGQVWGQPVTVNKLIGDTLNLEERNYYLLFQNVEGFQWAVFYLNQDSLVNVQVRYLKDGSQADTLIENFTNLTSLDYNLKLKYAFDHPEADTDQDGVSDLDELSKYNTDPLVAERISGRSLAVSEGEDIIVHDKLGREISGKLLSIRPNSLLLLKPGCNKDMNGLDCIEKLNYSEIDKLVIEGNSYLGLGIGLGVGASVIAGLISAAVNYDPNSMGIDPKDSVPVVVASAIFIGVGTAIGVRNSKPDIEINSFTEEVLKELRSFSRYPVEEPEELQKIE